MTDLLEDPKAVPLQVFTTAASLLDLVDKRVVLTLRDGKTLIGTLRSFDSFGNLVLQETTERIYLEGVFGETNRGVWIVRGENVALVGELDLERENATEARLKETWQMIDFAEAEKRFADAKAQAKAEISGRSRASLAAGLEPARLGDDSNQY